MNQTEQKVHALFKQYGNRVQLNVMDIGKVLDAARKAIEAGGDGVAEIKEAIEKYKVDL